MRYLSRAAVLSTLLALAPSILAVPELDMALLARAIDYEDEVCHPVVQMSETVPPCLNLITIETVCTANGTSPLALKAHQQCKCPCTHRSHRAPDISMLTMGRSTGMCNGSFFSEWPFCLQCLFIHGLRSERDVAFYKSILSTVSSSLCSAPTPTAEFASIFSSIQAAAPFPTTGDTVSSDRAVGQTAVSLYFTATTHQGPGRITGAATAATASVLFTAPAITPTTGPASGGKSGTGTSSSTNTASGAGASAKPSGTGNGATSTVSANGGLFGVVIAAAVAVAGAIIIS